MILLHRDPLISKIESERKPQEYCLEEMSENFFAHINQYSIQSLFGLNGEGIRENLLTICAYDHLRYYICYSVLKEA